MRTHRFVFTSESVFPMDVTRSLTPSGTGTARFGPATPWLRGKRNATPKVLTTLRFLRDGKRVWQRISQDADVAITALRNTEHDLQATALGRSVPTPIVDPNVGLPDPAGVDKRATGIDLSGSFPEAAIRSYLEEIQRFRSRKTIAACEHMLNLFGSKFPGKVIKDITRKDLLDHILFLQERGLGDRTIYNNIARIGTLMKSHGVVGLLSAADKPQRQRKYFKDQCGPYLPLFTEYLEGAAKQRYKIFATFAVSNCVFEGSMGHEPRQSGALRSYRR